VRALLRGLRRIKEIGCAAYAAEMAAAKSHAVKRK